jgi:Zn-finger protein
MCVLIFCTNFALNIYNSKKNSVRYCHKCKYVHLRVKYALFLSDFN